VAEMLMDLGHRRFAFFGPQLGGKAWSDPAMMERLRGVMDVVSRRGGLFLAQHILSAANKDMEASLQPILGVRPQERPTAIVVAHTGYLWILQQAHEKGLLRIPQDISVAVIGSPEAKNFGGMEWGGAFFDSVRMGLSAVAALRGQIVKGEAPGRLILEGFSVENGATLASPPSPGA